MRGAQEPTLHTVPNWALQCYTCSRHRSASASLQAGTQCPVPGQCPHLVGNGVPSASQCLAVTAVGDLKVMVLTVKKGQMGHYRNK